VSITVKKFQNGAGTDYLVGILFETGGRELRMLSNETPCSGLYEAAALVVLQVRKYLELPECPYSLKEISFGAEDSTISFFAPSRGGDIKVSLPKIDAKEVVKVRKEGGIKIEEYDEDHPRNHVNEAIRALRGELEHYIKGVRQQMSFEFERDQNEALNALGVGLGVITPERAEESGKTLEFIHSRQAAAGVL
jgi:signal recognition particle subunit SEC65